MLNTINVHILVINNMGNYLLDCYLVGRWFGCKVCHHMVNKNTGVNISCSYVDWLVTVSLLLMLQQM